MVTRVNALLTFSNEMVTIKHIVVSQAMRLNKNVQKFAGVQGGVSVTLKAGSVPPPKLLTGVLRLGDSGGEG